MKCILQEGPKAQTIEVSVDTLTLSCAAKYLASSGPLCEPARGISTAQRMATEDLSPQFRNPNEDPLKIPNEIIYGIRIGHCTKEPSWF